MTEQTGGLPLSESVENYLETILEIEALQDTPVRSVDIAAHLHVSRASVSKAIHLLREAGMVEFGHYGQVALTPGGRQAAAEVLERHLMLKNFLTGVLGVEESIADAEACRMEHAIGSETKRKWMEYLRRVL